MKMDYEYACVILKSCLHNEEPLPVEGVRELLVWLVNRKEELKSRPTGRPNEFVVRINALQWYYGLLNKGEDEGEARVETERMYGLDRKYMDTWLEHGRYAKERNEAKKRAETPADWIPVPREES